MIKSILWNRDSYSSPKSTTSDIDLFCPQRKDFSECFKCWGSPPPVYKEEVKLDNPKYCTLYPRKERKILKKAVPSFEGIKTLYTKCDFKLEQCVHVKIKELEMELKNYEMLFQHEKQLQEEYVEKLWELSFRYMLLKNSCCCIKFFPDIVSLPTEQRELCEFFEFLSKLNHSNRRLTRSLRKIKIIFEELDERRSQLDVTLESPFVNGEGAMQYPLHKVYEMVSDVFNYFHTSLCKLKCWAQLIDPADSPAIVDYKNLLLSLNSFGGFLMYGEEECTCRRSKAVDCIKHVRPC